MNEKLPAGELGGLRARLAATRETIARAAAEAKRPAKSIRLVGVCKAQPIAKIQAMIELGLEDLGGNYVQELRRQSTLLGKDFAKVRWHFVGALQRNKVKDLLRLFADRPPLFHTVDRESLLRELDRQAAALSINVSCLIQILPESDFVGKTGRAGCPAEQVLSLLKLVCELPHITVIGLMILPPVEETSEATRRHFRFLRDLGASLAPTVERFSCERLVLREYSMGMTADLHEAILEGATLVRVGTGLFGERERSP